jgi:hypothetical protein
MSRRLPILLILSIAIGAARAGESPTRFEVTYSPEVRPGPISARVYVMLGPADADREPRKGPDWFDTEPFFAVEAKEWKPDEPLSVGEDAVGYPGPLSELKPGRYAAQAVVRLNPDTHRLGDGEGNAYSAPLRFTVGGEDSAAVRLRVDRVVPPRRLRETDRIKLVDIPSPLLSEFHHRPIRHRAAVVLPEGLPDGEKRPTLYSIPGFGGSAFHVREGGGASYGRDYVRVVLDPDCGTGHHVFADSATNGPRGRALIEELIPYIEQSYPVLPDPRLRLLTGHSSGGWSSLWLQVSYPDTFGGTWSTSPDPVDFRDFQRIDIYARDANLFRDREGHRRPLAREGTRPVLWFDRFSRMEDVIGSGGQLHSFEAVFSPPGPDGQPRPLWDRRTGAIDPEVAKAWEDYDIRLVLERNWDTLGPRLGGKLHIFTGGLDTFYLEGAVRRLKTALAGLGSDAEVEVVPGKDHGNLVDASLAGRIDREMHEAVEATR